MKPCVLFILHLPPPVHGAAMMGKYIRDSRRINEAFDCHYINLTTAKDLTDIGKMGLKKLVQFVKLLRAIRREVKALKPDLVYVTPNACGGAFYKDFVVVEMLKRMGCRVVAHYHNKGVRTHQDRWLDDRLYRRFFRGLNVMLLADALYDDVCKYVDRTQVVVCPNGIPALPAMGEAKGRVGEDPPHLLWLSNLMRSKGLLEYLEALRQLRQRGVSFVADFVGGTTAEMDEVSFDRALRAGGLDDCAHYAGRQYGADKLAYYKRAAIFVLPSYSEAFPLTVLEAMQQSLPVVATNVGGVSEQVKDGLNGFLIGEGRPAMEMSFRPDSVALADALERLLKDEELRRRMGQAGRKRFEEGFTLEAFEKNFIRAMRKVSGAT
ncbi:MAG: glycosyltransferase family 4 protein [Bacteroidaceae bacterium]